MRQAWHIFRKDVRHLYREIVFLLALALLFGWLARPDAHFGVDTADTMQLLYAAAAAYTIARLVHAEPIPGDTQFWITRPYRWPSLMTAKILFVIAFVHLPVLLMQTVILLLNGFPAATFLAGLLWSQILIALAITLPCFAIAAMTAGLISFVGSFLVLFLAGFVVYSASYRTVAFAPESLDWIRYAIPFVTAAIAFIPAVYVQYRKRRTVVSEILAAGAAAFGALMFLYLPWTAMFHVQTLISKQSLPVEIKRDPAKPFYLHPDNRGRAMLVYPLTLLVSGVPEGSHLQIEKYDLQLKDPDGRMFPVSGGRSRLDRKQSQLLLAGELQLDPAFFLRAQRQPVMLRLSLYMTLFGNARDKTIPFQTAAVNALDGLRCFDGYFDEIVCRAPFRWPGTIVSAKSPWGGLTTFTRLISYSPFPANLQLSPIAERSAGPHWDKRGPIRKVTIEVEQPLEYLRRDVEIPDLSLGGQ